MTENPEKDPAVVGIEDFRATDIASAIAGRTRHDYYGLSTSLATAARTARDNERPAQEKVLHLLANACSLLLFPTSPNESFRPFKVIEGQRSFAIEDFRTSDLSLIADIAKEVDDPLLRARLADLAWHLVTPRDFRLAHTAIDAYRQIKPNNLTWPTVGRDCFDRATYLARLLGRGAGNRLAEIEAEALEAFGLACVSNPLFAVDLAESMHRHRLGMSSALSTGKALVALAGSSTESLGNVRAYLGAAIQWFRVAGDSAETVAATVRVAALWAKEATDLLSADNPSSLVVAHCIERAIQTYRSIPRASREAHSIEDRIRELRTLLSGIGEKRIDDLRTVTSPPINLEQIILHARGRLHGKTGDDALWALAMIHGGISVSTIRASATQIINSHPFQSLFDSAHLSRDGRVIARQVGSSALDDNPQGTSTAVWAQMIKLYQIQIGIIAQGQILPALEEASILNRFREEDLATIAALSPIVPYGREKLIGKALHLGLERDFVSAAHILVPQIEHLARFLLKANAEKTTTVDEGGIEHEVGLSTLAESSVFGRIFGEDLSFEIRALLCDQFGPNLRNEIAHGLIDDTTCYTPSMVYVWHLGMRLVLISYWNSRHSAVQQANVE